MSELKATPGPWTYKSSNGKLHAMIVSSKGAGGGKILAVFKKDPNPHNAELMNAAPELYEALENLLGVVYGVGGTKPNAQQIAKNALAKARGDS